MATFGSGMAPSGPTLAEMNSATRRGYMPGAVVQLYGAAPTLAAALANANMATGGLNPINVNVQGSSMTQTQATDYSAAFNIPSNLLGLQSCSFTLKAYVTPIPVPGFEATVQDEHAIVDVLGARMNDSTNNMVDLLATNFMTNSSNTLEITGLPAAIDDGTVAATYGGITRSTNPFWASKRYNAASANLTQALALQYIVGTTKSSGGEMPTMAIAGLGTWTTLAMDVMAQTGYQIQPGTGFDMTDDGPRAAFNAVTVAGVPFYADPYVPEGTLYLINTNYLSLYLNRHYNFTFTGFESTIPNYQYGWVGLVLTLLELVNVKPKASAVVTNLNFANL